MPFDCCGTGVAPISFSRNFYRSDSQRSWIAVMKLISRRMSIILIFVKFSNFFLMFKYIAYPSRFNCFFTCLIHQHNVVIKWTPYFIFLSHNITRRSCDLISSCYTTKTSASLILIIIYDHLRRSLELHPLASYQTQPCSSHV